MQERIDGLRNSVAGISQRMQAPKNWIGSGSVNLFQVVCDVLDLMEQMNSQLVIHTHGPTPPPENANAFTEEAFIAAQLASRLKVITEF